jgi:hypothetical protein
MVSYVDRPRVCNLSACMQFHSLHFRNFFCPQLTLSNSPSGIFLFPGQLPKMIVTGLAALACLKTLVIEFKPPLSFLNQGNRHPPLPTLTVLPALTRFVFNGHNEYLEDLVARIDAPSLDSICITFAKQRGFEIAQLAQFMRRDKILCGQ